MTLKVSIILMIWPTLEASSITNFMVMENSCVINTFLKAITKIILKSMGYFDGIINKTKIKVKKFMNAYHF